MYIDNVLADLIFQLHIHKPATFNWSVYAKPGKCAGSYFCVCYGIFLRFFLLNFGTIPTMRYILFFILSY